jgi:HD-GYP domain-containing protein (c-di-GMP phosphodiesterase class II)
MALTFPNPLRCLDQRQPIQDRLRRVHDRLLAIDSRLERLAFAVYQPHNDLLSTYVSRNERGPNLSFYDAPLAAIPSLQALASCRCCRIIDDMAQELPSTSAHSRWLLQHGWRSSYTVPLFREEHLLGFLFVNGFEPGLFTAELRHQIDPHLELLGAVLNQELSNGDSLRVAVQLALRLTGLRDPETGAHVERVSLYSRLIAMELGKRHALRSDFAEDIYLFAALHDVGKVGIADEILLKPGPLDAEERREMQTHVQRGSELIEEMLLGLRLVADPKVAMLRHVVAGHHEKLDGSGYPLGLTAEEISLEARIVAVADIYDALCNVRPYKPALPQQEVERIMQEMADRGQIDAECLEILLDNREQRQAIASAYSEPSLPGKGVLWMGEEGVGPKPDLHVSRG